MFDTIPEGVCLAGERVCHGKRLLANRIILLFSDWLDSGNSCFILNCSESAWGMKTDPSVRKETKCKKKVRWYFKIRKKNLSVHDDKREVLTEQNTGERKQIKFDKRKEKTGKDRDRKSGAYHRALICGLSSLDGTVCVLFENLFSGGQMRQKCRP